MLFILYVILGLEIGQLTLKDTFKHFFDNACIFFQIQIHTLVESLKLSLTDQQLPMFIRLMQLGIALYYGEISDFKDGETEDPACHSKDALGSLAGQHSADFV